MKKIICLLIFIILINPALAFVYLADRRVETNRWYEYDVLKPDGSVNVTIGISFRRKSYGSKENLSFEFLGNILNKEDSFEVYFCEGMIDVEDDIIAYCLEKKQKISVENNERGDILFT